MASTYTVNLGIEKIGTGEQSGTWGNTTNTNFDLIDQAVNGAVTVTLASAGTSGSPNSLVITNGAASDGRNKFIEFNDGGDLGATAYVQLDPNDAEKIVHMRNSLSGGRSVIVFQGTYNASNDFEIPNGKDVVLKFDGAGASATVMDVFTDLQATAITTPSLTATTADINGGNIDGTVIGAATPAAGSFTTGQFGTSLNVDGTVTANGLTVDAGGSSAILIQNANPGLVFDDNSAVGAGSDKFIIRSVAAQSLGDYELVMNNDQTSSSDVTVAKFAGNGDISFFEDTGTTPKFFWDASAESLGIGTTSPLQSIDTTGNILLRTNGSYVAIRNSSGVDAAVLSMTASDITNVGAVFTGSQLALRAGGSEAMRITSAGDVGIGTTSPQGILEVVDTNPILQIRDSQTSAGSATATLRMGESGLSGIENYWDIKVNGSDGALQFIDNWSGGAGTGTRMVISDGGNVGIGTSSPAGITSGITTLAISDAGAKTTGDKTGALAFITDDGSFTGTFSDGVTAEISSVSETGVGGAYGLAFATATTSGSNRAERMRIDSAGNVGIGTSSPERVLHAVSGQQVVAVFESLSATAGRLGVMDTGTTGSDYVGIGADGDDLKLYSGGANPVTITSAGKVGIGTSTVAQKLLVSNGIDTDGGPIGIGLGSVTDSTRKAIFIKNTTSPFELTIQSGAGGTTAPIVFKQTASGEAMRIDSSGNVGIGSSTIDGYYGSSPANTRAVVAYSSASTNVDTAPKGLVVRNDNTTTSNLSQMVFGTLNTGNTPIAVASIYSVNDARTSGFSTGSLGFGTVGGSGIISERMRIDSSGNVGIGTTPASGVRLDIRSNAAATLGDFRNASSTGFGLYVAAGDTDSQYAFRAADYQNNALVTITGSGNLLVGKTVTTFNTTGFLYEAGAAVEVTRSGNRVMRLNRTTNDGSILEFNKDGGTVGSIGVNGSRPYLANNVNFGIKLDDFGGGQLQPATTAGAVQDNACDLGGSSARWDDIYATNGTIQTSDANEKQDIRDLSEAEARVAQAAKALLKAFRWKDSVAEKGDDARIHFGIIAQDLQAAFEAEGLDAGRYAMFIHSTWTDEETGEERSRMGVRYSELLAFIIAAL